MNSLQCCRLPKAPVLTVARGFFQRTPLEALQWPITELHQVPIQFPHYFPNY